MTPLRVPLADVLHPDVQKIKVSPDYSYPSVGVLNHGRGLFMREPIDGSTTSYRSLYQIRTGQLIYSRLFAWEGAVTIVPAEFDGYYVSHEFPTFVVDKRRIDPEYLECLTRWPDLHEQLAKKTQGLGVRRQRVSPDQLLTVEVPLPGKRHQRQIARQVNAIHVTLARAKDLVAKDSSKALLAALPRLTQAIFSAEGTRTEPVSALADFVGDVVHPGDDLGKATLFVGLQHVEGHSGVRIGDLPVGNEKGRRFRFQPGDVVYGYLRPYLNKVWVADCHGLCSVDQYVLRPHEGVSSQLLAYGLRTGSTLDEVIRLTHSLQLPRLRSGLLADLHIPTANGTQEKLLQRLNKASQLICEAARLRYKQLALVAALETGTLNWALAVASDMHNTPLRARDNGMLKESQAQHISCL